MPCCCKTKIYPDQLLKDFNIWLPAAARFKDQVTCCCKTYIFGFLLLSDLFSCQLAAARLYSLMISCCKTEIYPDRLLKNFNIWSLLLKTYLSGILLLRDLNFCWHAAVRLRYIWTCYSKNYLSGDLMLQHFPRIWPGLFGWFPDCVIPLVHMGQVTLVDVPRPNSGNLASMFLPWKSSRDQVSLKKTHADDNQKQEQGWTHPHRLLRELSHYLFAGWFEGILIAYYLHIYI